MVQRVGLNMLSGRISRLSSLANYGIPFQIPSPSLQGKTTVSSNGLIASEDSSSCAPHSQSSQVTTKAPLRLMPLGGSITFGVGSSDRNGYRKFLLEMLLSRKFEASMVGSRKSGSMDNNDHEGWRGYRIEQILSKAKRSVDVVSPSVFIINAGSNDCIQNFEMDSFGKRMDVLVEYLWRTSPHSTILLSTLLVNLDKDTDSRVQHVNKQIIDLKEWKAAEQKKIVLVDMRSPQGPQINDLIDGTHPNDIGYKKMANICLGGIYEAAMKGFL